MYNLCVGKTLGRFAGLSFGLAILAGSLAGQTTAALSNASLRGTYFFRHLQFTTDTSSNVIDSRAALGTIVFDGAGRYGINGFQTVNSSGTVNLALIGTYAVGAAGDMTLTNPQRTGLRMNGRAGVEAILATTTESGDNTFDLFAAIPAPLAGASPSLTGRFYFANFDLQLGAAGTVRSSLSAVTSGGNGAFDYTTVGHSATVSNGALVTENVSGSAYSLSPDGTGTVNFGFSNTGLTGTKNLYVSQSGNVILGGSLQPGTQDFLIGVRALAEAPASGSISGLFWEAGLRLDLAHKSTQSYIGALNGLSTLGRAVFADRLHQIGISPGYDFTGENDVVVNPAGNFPNGTLGMGSNLVGLGVNGATLVEVGLSRFDTSGYSIDFGIQALGLTGAGVYINPLGVVNAASLAPAGQSISPGEFVSLFGSGLAAQQMAASPPYPSTLSGVSVSVNGVAAPVYFVNAGQVNFIVPYGVTGSSAVVVVTSNGVASNSVTVPLQKTSPGIFSVDGSGTGDGTVAHASGALVSAANPARKGETVTVYVGGLGTVTPAPADGAAGGSNPLSMIDTPVAVTIGGQATTIAFAGLAPGFPGLYQLNVTIPSTLSGTGRLPLALQTSDTFTDQVDIVIQ